MILKTYAHARAGLIGNPSDGYFGKTISFIIRNFKAEVTLYESPELLIEPDHQDISRFDSIQALTRDVHRHGYYGGVRLIKAAIKKFGDYCGSQGIELDDRNFTVRYTSNIPRLVGMAGSSAIITATYRALMHFYGVKIPKRQQPNLILSTEHDELGISAGLQDRVIQVYEDVVYMDFDKKTMDADGAGVYENIDPVLLPSLYVAYDPERSEGSEKTHNQVRALFDKGDPETVSTMAEIADLALEARDALKQGEGKRLHDLMNRNYDLRTRIMNISPENARMVNVARKTGASAKFAGSGGTVVGVYEDESMYRKLTESLEAIGCSVFKPEIAAS